MHRPPAHPIGIDLVERLKRLRAQLGAVPMPSRPVFASEDGSWLRSSNVLWRQWHPLLVDAGLETCGFHRLRHTYASAQLHGGIDVTTVSKLLGHADPAITLQTYAHFVPGREDEAPAAFDAFVSGGGRHVG